METVIVALFCVALILFGALTLSQVSLSSTDEIATAWRQMEAMTSDIARTNISTLSAETQSDGSIVEVTLRNSGETKLTNFEDWDVILEFYSVGMASAIFNDSFEDPIYLGNWTQDGQNQWDTDNEEVRGGLLSAHFEGNGSDATLTLTDPIDLTLSTPQSLVFSWMIESGFDAGEYLALDLWNGTSWDLSVLQLDGNVDTEDVWHDESVDISAYQIVDFRCRFRGSTNNANEDAFVDLVQINAVPPAHFVEWLSYTDGTPGDGEWTVEGIYLDAATSEPEVFDPGILNPDEEIVLQMQINPAIEAGATNQLTVVTGNGVSASAIFIGT